MTPPIVLVVDDEPLVRMVLADYLREDRFHVLEAANADEALQLLQEQPDISAVITDVRMPGSMNGFGLARELESRWPHVKVFLTSAHFDPQNGDLPASASFVAKPYHPDQFVTLLSAGSA